jgi:hypothetical protein
MRDMSLTEIGVVAFVVAISFALPYIVGFLINCKMDKWK